MRRPARSTTGMPRSSGSALNTHESTPATTTSSPATAPMKTASSSPWASRVAASRTRPRNALADASSRRFRAMRRASSPVRSPTTTRETAVRTSLSLEIVNCPYGWVSRIVNVNAALAVAPTTAGRLPVAPAAVMTSTRAIATMTSLYPARNGTQSPDTPVAAPDATRNAAADGHTCDHPVAWGGRGCFAPVAGLPPSRDRTGASIRTPDRPNRAAWAAESAIATPRWPRPQGGPLQMAARIDMVAIGYADDRVASTIALVRDGASTVVVDPGMVADRRRLLARLDGLGAPADEVTDVVFSHHHPDHTLNAALFENARFHDHWAIYKDDVWEEREADGWALSPSVRLLATPGHTSEDLTTLVETDGGLVACTHLWWSAGGPEIDPLAVDQARLESSRAALLALGPALIVPGHGAPFAPG